MSNVSLHNTMVCSRWDVHARMGSGEQLATRTGLSAGGDASESSKLPGSTPSASATVVESLEDAMTFALVPPTASDRD